MVGCASTSSRAAASLAGVSTAVLARIPISDFGTGIAIAPDGLHAYVAASANIFVIDTRTNQVSGTITTGNVPYAIALAADGKRGYAVDLLQTQLWILDLETNQLARRIWIGEPRTPVLRPGVAVSPDGSHAWFTISQPEQQGPGDSIRTLDTASGELTQRGLDFHPGAIVASRSPGQIVVVGCHGFCSDGTLHLLDPSQPRPVATVPLPSVPGGVALSPDGAQAYVANGLAATVSVVDLPGGTIRATVPVGAEPLGLAFHPNGAYVYVTNFQGASLSAINTRTNQVVATVGVGATPRAIAVHPAGRVAYVTSSEPVVSVIDLQRLAP